MGKIMQGIFLFYLSYGFFSYAMDFFDYKKNKSNNCFEFQVPIQPNKRRSFVRLICNNKEQKKEYFFKKVAAPIGVGIIGLLLYSFIKCKDEFNINSLCDVVQNDSDIILFFPLLGLILWYFEDWYNSYDESSSCEQYDAASKHNEALNKMIKKEKMFVLGEKLYEIDEEARNYIHFFEKSSRDRQEKEKLISFRDNIMKKIDEIIDEIDYENDLKRATYKCCVDKRDSFGEIFSNLLKE